MADNVVGSIKNINYKTESGDLEVTVSITNNKFKKKLLRDLSLSGNIKFVGNELIYMPNIEDGEKE